MKKNLTSGTNSTTLNLQKVKSTECAVKDICRLIVACKENGVSELKFGELHLLFGNGPEKSPEEITPSAAIPSEDLKAQEQVSKEAEAQLRFAEEQDDVSLMVLEDPAEMERRIANGELIDEVAQH